MPDKSSKRAARALRTLRQRAKAMLEHVRQESGAEFLMKPWQVQALASAIRRVMTAPSSDRVAV